MGCGASASRVYKVDGEEDGTPTLPFLRKVPVFASLPEDKLSLLAGACQPERFSKDQVVIQQGEVGSEFFLIKKGLAIVTVADAAGGDRSITLREGDFFGERALLYNEPRSATVKAASELFTVKVTQTKFRELGLHEEVVFAYRKAVRGGRRVVSKIPPPSPKTAEERDFIAKALRSNKYLSSTVRLDDEKVDAMIDISWREEVPKGRQVIREGDVNADFFYVVGEGHFSVFVAEEVKPRGGDEVVQKQNPINSVEKGSSFGEMALIVLEPRSATVEATVDSVVWVFDRDNFKKILMKTSDHRIKQYMGYLDSVTMLNPLGVEEKRQVAEAMIEKVFVKDDVIMEQGDPGTCFYVLIDGDVKVLQDGKELRRLDACSKKHIVRTFGERALLNDDVRTASIVAVSEDVRTLALDRDTFNLVLGPLAELIHDKKDGEKKPPRPEGGGAQNLKPPRGSKGVLRQRLQSLHQKEEKSPGDALDVNQLQKLGVLGRGAFGVVELYKHMKFDQVYAIKAMSKAYIVENDLKEAVIQEKEVMLQADSPFIIHCHGTYTTATCLHFVMEAALGGDLLVTYTRQKFHGSQQHTKYYTAGVICALEHLHGKRIIHRDLKPENVLITQAGHMKLADMGLSIQVVGMAHTLCGTADYMAPEVVVMRGYTNAVDWWALGVLMYELMTSVPPFAAPTTMATYERIVEGIDKVKFPDAIKPSMKDLIKSMMTKDAAKRLPVRQGGMQKLWSHRWFSGFNWIYFKKLTMPPPYKPRVKNNTDRSNFSVRPGAEDLPETVPYKDDGSGWDADFATLKV